MEVQIAGMAWFDADDYEAFRALLPERSWHPTFAAWLRAAEQGLEQLKDRGIVGVKAHVRSDAFAQWCTSTGRHVETKALLDFANEFAAREHLGHKSH